MNVKVCNLCRSFGPVKAANNASFELQPGKIYGFIGPNGSGKTTILRIMAGLDQPNSGDVLYDNLSVTLYPDKIRSLIGYMPDTLPAYSDMQVWEYLDFFARSFGLTGENRAAVLADTENFTGVTSFRTAFLNTLSKGMKQRVSLARALLHHPQVLLLDEPAAGLDPRARYELRVMLKALVKRNLTIFMSSHILSELQDMCDGAVIIKQGSIVAAGLLADLQNQLEQDTAPQAPDVAPNAAASSAPATVTSHLCLLLKTLGPAENLRLALAQLPEAVGAEAIGEHEIKAHFNGDDTLIPSVLTRLLQAGIPIAEVRKADLGLEEMFIQYTR